MDRWLKYRAKMRAGAAPSTEWSRFLLSADATTDKLHHVVLAVISLLPQELQDDRESLLNVQWEDVVERLKVGLPDIYKELGNIHEELPEVELPEVDSPSPKYGAAVLAGASAGYYLAPQLEQRLTPKNRRRAAALLGGLGGAVVLRTFEELVSAVEAPDRLGSKDRDTLEADLKRLSFRTEAYEVKANQEKVKAKQEKLKADIRECLHALPSYTQGVHNVCGMFLEHGMGVEETRLCLLKAEKYLGQQWFSPQEVQYKVLMPSGTVRVVPPTLFEDRVQFFLGRYVKLFVPICLDALSNKCAEHVWDYVFSDSPSAS